jgi:hypothetical protein
MANKESDKSATKKTTTKKSTSKKPVTKKVTNSEVKMTVTKKPTVKKSSTEMEKEIVNSSRFSVFFKNIKENVSEGAKALANLSSDLLEDVKEKAEDFYGKGAEKFVQASGVVENYIDHYKGEKEIKQLTKEKEDLNEILGSSIYHEFKKNGSISKRFLTTKKSEELFSSIESIDKRILKLGKELDNK